ncbi:MAG: hypothetical protein IAI48_04220 [Candidatus Eremiobacteraeota bacterium]|nr:hypothetical protein [Candidatus Eremiobacteraeota bacterium]
MIDRDDFYDSLCAIVADLNNGEGGSDLGDFAFAMRRAQTGVSLDQAIQAAFEECVPPKLADVPEALSYAALFLQKELVDFWRCEECQPFVDEVRLAGASRISSGVSPLIQKLVLSLQSRANEF